MATSHARYKYASTLAVASAAAVLSCGWAAAQDPVPLETVTLPSIDVTTTRLVIGANRGTSGEPARRVAPAPATDVAVTPAAPSMAPATAPSAVTAPGGVVAGTIITGASSTIISSTDIQRSPGQTLQDLLAREPGVQVRSLFGGVNGAQTTVDMRGFGATGNANTLVLVNGRRLNDIDLAGIDFSAIPRDSIERIEVTRGNSGAVLYGDGAQGGVINIITKTGAGLPPSARVQGAFGSFNYREGSASANSSWGPFTASAYGNAVNSDGYRQNNDLRQRNAVGDVRYNDGTNGAYLNITGDDQHLGLPGARLVTATSSQLLTDRRGAATPFDYANKNGANATLGVTRVLFPGTELILDGGVRQKDQTAAFFSSFGSAFDSGFKATLTTASFTPRLSSQHNFGTIPGKLLAGVDVYDSSYDSNRSVHLTDPPNHHYDLHQTTTAGYFQETLGLWPRTDVAFGARVQENSTTARDRLDMTAPGGAFLLQGLPLDRSETQYALHVGAEHRLTDQFAVFARAARSFRLPTVDERVGMSPFGTPTTFDLKTQTSHDIEGGYRLQAGKVTLQSSVYRMDLKDEIFFSPATFTNTNLDPTRRYGVESIAVWQVLDNFRLKGGAAYTRSVFREGPFKDKDVPLVSLLTTSAGASWDVYQKYLVFDVVARYFGPKRMDNDSANFQPQIPGHTIVDLRIGGEIQKFFWSLSAQNVFNVKYYDYAVASAFTFGTFNAYPLPGTVVVARAGVTW